MRGSTHLKVMVQCVHEKEKGNTHRMISIIQDLRSGIHLQDVKFLTQGSQQAS